MSPSSKARCIRSFVQRQLAVSLVLFGVSQLVCSALVLTSRVSEHEGDADSVIDAAAAMIDAYLAPPLERAA